MSAGGAVLLALAASGVSALRMHQPPAPEQPLIGGVQPSRNALSLGDLMPDARSLISDALLQYQREKMNKFLDREPDNPFSLYMQVTSRVPGEAKWDAAEGAIPIDDEWKLVRVAGALDERNSVIGREGDDAVPELVELKGAGLDLMEFYYDAPEGLEKWIERDVIERIVLEAYARRFRTAGLYLRFDSDRKARTKREAELAKPMRQKLTDELEVLIEALNEAEGQMAAVREDFESNGSGHGDYQALDQWKKSWFAAAENLMFFTEGKRILSPSIYQISGEWFDTWALNHKRQEWINRCSERARKVVEIKVAGHSTTAFATVLPGTQELVADHDEDRYDSVKSEGPVPWRAFTRYARYRARAFWEPALVREMTVGHGGHGGEWEHEWHNRLMAIGSMAADEDARTVINDKTLPRLDTLGNPVSFDSDYLASAELYMPVPGLMPEDLNNMRSVQNIFSASFLTKAHVDPLERMQVADYVCREPKNYPRWEAVAPGDLTIPMPPPRPLNMHDLLGDMRTRLNTHESKLHVYGTRERQYILWNVRWDTLRPQPRCIPAVGLSSFVSRTGMGGLRAAWLRCATWSGMSKSRDGHGVPTTTVARLDFVAQTLLAHVHAIEREPATPEHKRSMFSLRVARDVDFTPVLHLGVGGRAVHKRAEQRV